MVNRLHYFRREKRLRQRDLALLVGISELHISRLETGRVTPDAALAKKIADALSVPEGEIFHEGVAGENPELASAAVTGREASNGGSADEAGRAGV